MSARLQSQRKKPRVALIAALSLLFTGVLAAQEVSLGEAARQAREAKQQSRPAAAGKPGWLSLAEQAKRVLHRGKSADTADQESNAAQKQQGADTSSQTNSADPSGA